MRLIPRTKLTLCSLLVALPLAVAGLAVAPANATSTPVSEIASVTVTKQTNGLYFIEVIGCTSTGGWAEPALSLKGAPGADGRYDVDFKAEAPSGSATQAFQAIRTDALIDSKQEDRPIPTWIVLHGERNTVNVILAGTGPVWSAGARTNCGDEVKLFN